VQNFWITAQHLAALEDVFLKDFYDAAHNAKGAVFQQAVNQLIEAGADQRQIEYLVNAKSIGANSIRSALFRVAYYLRKLLHPL
jgi:hypothetical protein